VQAAPTCTRRYNQHQEQAGITASARPHHSLKMVVCKRGRTVSEDPLKLPPRSSTLGQRYWRAEARSGSGISDKLEAPSRPRQSGQLTRSPSALLARSNSSTQASWKKCLHLTIGWTTSPETTTSKQMAQTSWPGTGTASSSAAASPWRSAQRARVPPGVSTPERLRTMRAGLRRQGR